MNGRVGRGLAYVEETIRKFWGEGSSIQRKPSESRIRAGEDKGAQRIDFG